MLTFQWIQIVLSSSTLFIGFSQAFQCQSCSYSYSEDNPDKDTACIKQPEIYTGWSVLKCRDYCVVQEIYSKEKRRIVAYWRSCSDKPDTGYCRGDTWLLTCFHSCQGDLCNSWVRGQLHEIYGGIPPPPEDTGNAAHPINAKPMMLLLALMDILIGFLLL